MNKVLIKVVLCCLFFCCSAQATFSQQRIAYIDTDVIIKAMPEYRITQSSLETFQKQLLKQLDAEKKAIAQYYTSVIEQVKRGEMTAQQQQEAEVKLQKMQSDLEQKTTEADQQLVAKEQVLSKPMYDKFEKGIETIAQKNSYAYILDKKLLMYATGGIDATDQLKKELGI
ncbi:OmpH family outer membrane protein [Aureispira anguillae]|uniref:OmpH family outer membrane protein n=1 Tax=Aureispira anguillae TaxID=2864201 RepID=A0A916DTI2_9BACT|nr:OmpH family outer membrane protein [Aureispira anguillae]BDS12576.1 OmpH family outer membrane protein [Aureispira anguillae]